MASSITDYRRIFFGNSDEELATLKQARTNGVTLATLVKGLFTASSSTTVGLTVKGVDGQTADLQQWQRSDDVAYTQIGATGKFSTVGQAFISNGATGTGPVLHIENASGASNVGLIVKGVTSQSGDLQQWQGSAETVLHAITAAGRPLFNALDGTAALGAYQGFINVTVAGTVRKLPIYA